MSRAALASAWQPSSKLEYGSYLEIELATFENTLLALVPINRMVPTTITRMTANITAYSAMSWPSSSDQMRRSSSVITLSSVNVFDLSGKSVTSESWMPGNPAHNGMPWRGADPSVKVQRVIYTTYDIFWSIHVSANFC